MWKPHGSGVTHILSCLPFLVSSLGFVVRKLIKLNIFSTLINQDKNILNAVFQWIQFICGIPALSVSCLYSVFIEFGIFIEFNNVANKMSSKLCIKLTKTYFLKVPIMENFQQTPKRTVQINLSPQTLHIWPVLPRPHIHLPLPFILIFFLTLFWSKYQISFHS